MTTLLSGSEKAVLLCIAFFLFGLLLSSGGNKADKFVDLFLLDPFFLVLVFTIYPWEVRNNMVKSLIWQLLLVCCFFVLLVTVGICLQVLRYNQSWLMKVEILLLSKL